MTLTEFFAQHPKAALGFSGGVDSSYLLAEGIRCGAEIHPYFIKTPFQPEFELEDALRLGKQLGVAITVLEYDILSHAEVTKNPQNRCYYCKTVLFSQLRQRAAADGYSLLIDGTNASDDAGDRPGMRALQELSVCSPLRECGLTKEQIRQKSKELGLFTWDKPAYACLATRIPTGTALSKEVLHRVELAEGKLFDMGFQDFRVRVYQEAARIQLPQAQWNMLLTHREQVLQALREYFPIVLLDLEVR